LDTAANFSSKNVITILGFATDFTAACIRYYKNEQQMKPTIVMAQNAENG